MSITKNFPGIQPDAFDIAPGWEKMVTDELVAELFVRTVAATQSRGVTVLSRRDADQLAANSLVAAYAFARLAQQRSKT